MSPVSKYSLAAGILEGGLFETICQKDINKS